MESLNQYFDHTLLKPDATIRDIEVLCHQADRLGCYAVCVNSCHVPSVSLLLQDSPVKVAAVCGFPLGAMSTDAKVYEANQACSYGADEIDMVINIGWLKSGEIPWVRSELSRMAETVHGKDSLLKVIVETHLLSDDELATACELIVETGCDFVKTSTGFTGGGADGDTIRRIRKLVRERARIKASGGIRDRAMAEEMIEAGADRIGASSTVSILANEK